MSSFGAALFDASSSEDESPSMQQTKTTTTIIPPIHTNKVLKRKREVAEGISNGTNTSNSSNHKSTTTTTKNTTSDENQPIAKKPKQTIDPKFIPLQPATADDKRIKHEVCFYDGFDRSKADPKSLNPPFPEVPARSYKFSLDPFQRTSVACIENSESVLVSAHTSAGKTVVAEYAIAKSLRDGQRVIYTSPIKALSNQKFRELGAEFKDVGLMTGDVTIDPNASCLVMTTEILRSMLYRGSEVLREVAWVIFDEIHYMRDKERGVVWEESISLLPSSIRFVFLSATIPNAPEFASWVATIHKQPVHVVYTEFRPVPLQHYIFPAGGQGIHLVVDEKGKFREDNFQKALSSINPNAIEDKKKGRRGGLKGKGPSDIYRVVKMIMDRNYDPVIVFAFSKRECESLALQMAKLDLNNDEEKKLADAVFQNAIDGLSDDDKTLPQVENILPLLRRGIGIHHSGLLPILKEIIEILFSEGLIKCLFATETFSMGLNMPAKTVIFTNVRKFDGQTFRWLSGGEYIQMSGRAGRRGLDDRGICILMIDEQMEPDVAKAMVYGHSDPLNSSYHLSYNSLLNLLRVEGVDPEYMLKRSFHQYQVTSNLPKLEAKVHELTAEKSKLTLSDEPAIAQYYSLKKQIQALNTTYRSVITLPTHATPYLQPGRLVKVSDAHHDWGWAVIINFQKLAPPRDGGRVSKHSDKLSASQSEALRYVIDVIVAADPSSLASFPSTQGGRAISSKSNKPTPLSINLPAPPSAGSLHQLPDSDHEEEGEEEPANQTSKTSSKNPSTPTRLSNVGGPRPAVAGETSPAMIIIPILLPTIESFSSIRIVPPKDLLNENSRIAVGRTIQEIQRRYPDGLPLVDPIQNMGIKDDSFKSLIKRISSTQSKLVELPITSSASLDQEYEIYSHKLALEKQIRLLKKEIRSSNSVVMKDELKSMKRVLRRLGYTNDENVIELKGRVACEINTANELVLTELIFTGMFNELSTEQITGLLAVMIFQEKSDDKTALPQELSDPLKQLQDAARRVAKIEKESKMSVDPDDFVASFKTALMPIATAWAQGKPFKDIVGMTDVFEGSIIRAIRRLAELASQLAAASKAIGNTELEAKFSDVITKIKRDIVFAASLYL